MLDPAMVRGIIGPFGCLRGDIEVLTEFGPLPISRIDRPMRVVSWNASTNRFELSLSSGALPKGKDYLYRVTTPQGEFVASGDHRLFCADHKYRRVEELSPGQYIFMFPSAAGGRIAKIERLPVKEIFWDLHVYGTNNYVTADGSVHHNSGKSVGCTMELLRQAITAPACRDGIRKTRFVIIRNTFRMLSDTTIKTVFEWIPPEKAGKWLSSRNTFYVKFGDVESEWMFRALDSPDDIRNLPSLEVTGAWINEFREIDSGVFVNLLGRVGRYRPDKSVPPGWSGIIMDSNPPEVDSYFYKLFEDDPPEEVQELARNLDRPLLSLYKQPSGLSPDAENVENLPENYYETLVAVNTDKSPEWVNVHVHGQYGYVQTGKPVFPEFSSVHISDKSLKASPRAPIVIGMDFGLTPAAIMVQQNPFGQWLILAELVADNMGIERFITRLVPFLQQQFPDHARDMKKEIWADPAGQARSDTDENTCFKSLRAAGFIVRPGPQDLETRLGSVRRVLNRLIEGKPGMLVDKSCKMLLKGFYGQYRYRRMHKSGEYYDEKPDKNEVSHVHDALQYVLGAYEGQGIKGRGNRKFGKGGFMKPVIVQSKFKVYG